VRRASEDEMLLCFLRAEMDSPTEGARLLAALDDCGLDSSVLTAPDVDDEEEHRARRNLFHAYRGGESVFVGLPWDDLTWYEATVTEADLRDRTVTCRNHFESRYGTRRIDQIAELWDRSTPPVPQGVLARIRHGETMQPPILISEPALERMVVLEGHNRLISYLRNPSPVTFPLSTLIGVSPHASRWCQW
jgi:hypothetical protein